MTSDHRVTPGLIHDILDALERHGYYRSDDLHADRAIGLIGDLACIYEGTQDHPAYPGPTRHDAHHPHPRRRQHRVRRGGYRRRRQALPRRDVPRLPRPVLPHLPDPPPRRPRPSTRWPTACSRPPKPPPLPAASQPGPDRWSQPAADREAGQ